MVSFGDVRRWAATPLFGAEQVLVDRAGLLIGLAGETGGWVGEAHIAAARDRRLMVDVLENAVAQLAAVRRAVGEAADAVDGLRYGVVEALELATIHNFAIDDAGVVHDGGAVPGSDERDRI